MSLTPEELATLYLEQYGAYRGGVVPERSEPNALYVWEDWICDDPERGWPVFEEILMRVSDDETFEQVWYRLRLLLSRHYDRFHERAAVLLNRFRRFAFVAGPGAVNRANYEEKPFDRGELIHAYRAMQRARDDADEVNQLAQSDPQRALGIALEIMHRGVERGWEAFDLMDPLARILENRGEEVVDQIEEIARTSVAVRRVIWRLKPQSHRRARMKAKVWERVEAAMGSTTDYTDRDLTPPPPQRQLDADERIIEAWFAHKETFWAFSELSDLCEEKPQLAWSITLELIEGAADPVELAVIAAGPLEDLIREHADVIWEDLTLKAHTEERLRSALRGVWVFPEDGEVFERFRQLLSTIEAESG